MQRGRKSRQLGVVQPGSSSSSSTDELVLVKVRQLQERQGRREGQRGAGAAVAAGK
jgi:hypothetical protein